MKEFPLLVNLIGPAPTQINALYTWHMKIHKLQNIILVGGTIPISHRTRDFIRKSQILAYNLQPTINFNEQTWVYTNNQILIILKQSG